MNSEPLNVERLQATLRQYGATWTAGVTPLTDLSRDEKKLRLGAAPPPGQATLDQREQVARANFVAGRGYAAAAAPPSYDLRNVNGKSFITSIKHQLSCGSCVAFGSVATVEGTFRVQRNDPDLAVDLSEAHLFYCHAAAQGRSCQTGWWVDPALDAFKNIGVVDEPCFPYTPGDQQCNVCGDWQDRVVKITAWRNLDTAADMKSWLASNGPLAACFKVYEDFYAYQSGVYRHTSGDFLGGHCVCVIGYNDSDGCWICKNSWGSNWGESGFFRIAYGDCGLDYTMWAVEVETKPSEGWQNQKLITGLWTINEDRNAAAYIDGVGWRNVANESDSVFIGLVTLLATAKASKALVNLREENGIIKEIYVF